MKFPDWGSGGIGQHLIRLKDGDTVPGVFRGEIVRFYQHWSANGQPSVCAGRDKCQLCGQGEKGIGRFRINFLIQENGAWVAKIFEAGRKVFDQLTALNKDMPLEKLKVRVSRSGSGKQTQISVNAFPGENGLVDTKLEKVIGAIQLHDLTLEKAEEDPEQDANEDVPGF